MNSNALLPAYEPPSFQIERHSFWWALGVIIILADQLTKLAAAQALRNTPWKAVYLDRLYITAARNPGILGIGNPSLGEVGEIASAAILALIIIYDAALLVKNGSVRGQLMLSLSLLFGGGAGNLCDRIRLGAVIEVIDIRGFIAFNLADVAIVIGFMILLCMPKRSGVDPADSDY